MSNRKFKIVEDSYYTDSMCWVGEPLKWTHYKVYEVVPDGTPDGAEKEVYTYSTPCELEEAYDIILKHLNIEVEVVYE